MQTCFNGATAMPYSLEQDISSAAGAGFESLELWGAKLERFLRNDTVAGLARMLKSHQLRTAAIDFITVDLAKAEPLVDAMPALRHYGEVATGIGCDTLLLIITGRRPELSKAETLNFVAKLMLPLTDVAARYGLRLAIEPLGGDPLVPGPNEAMEIIRISKRGSLGLTWDFFHYYKSGVSLADVRRIPPECLLLVHANDVPAKDPATLTDSDRLWPGEGILPLDDYFEVLRDLRYDGPVSVEVFNEDYWRMDPEAIAREAFESLEEFLPVRF
jgi:2-keto-myo-inositol isomerase